jgi:hypothetical protein
VIDHLINFIVSDSKQYTVAISHWRVLYNGSTREDRRTLQWFTSSTPGLLKRRSTPHQPFCNNQTHPPIRDIGSIGLIIPRPTCYEKGSGKVGGTSRSELTDSDDPQVQE